MKKLQTVIITCLNDKQIHQTCKTLILWADQPLDIIVVDDASDEPISINHPWVIVIRNKLRLGCSGSREVGIQVAVQKRGFDQWVGIFDSHMLFPSGWLSAVNEHIADVGENTVLSGTYTVVPQGTKAEDTFKPFKPRFIGGADYFFYLSQGEQYKIDTIKPRVPQKDWRYEVPVMMGAAYFMNLQWHRYIRGWAGMMWWGSEEASYCRKTWLSGGRVLVMGDVQIAHIDTPPPVDRTPAMYIGYNALHSLALTLPESGFKELLNILVKRERDQQLHDAVQMFTDCLDVNRPEYEHMQKIRVKSNDWFCDKFNLPRLEDCIDRAVLDIIS